MRTFSLFDPKIYSLLLFRVTRGSEKELVESIHSCIKPKRGVKTEISYKEGWTIIEIAGEIVPGSTGYVSVSPDIFKLRLEENRNIIRKAREIISNHMQEGMRIHVYNLFTCGSDDRSWMRTSGDMSFLIEEEKLSEEDMDQKERDLYQANISRLNRMMNRSEEVNVNSLKNGKISALLYLFGKKQGKDVIPYPNDMLLEIDMSEIKSSEIYREPHLILSEGSPYDDKGQGDRSGYLKRQNYLINLLAMKSKLLEIFLIQCDVLEKITGEIADVKLKGSNLKDEIFEMQNSINEHMKHYIPTGGGRSRKKGKTFLDKDTYEKEKELLTGASVQFSLISEAEHEIMRYRSRLVDMQKRINDRAGALSMSGEDYAPGGSTSTIGDITENEIDREYRILKDLMEELSHSRDILSSNIEVLRTFIDTRQREVSEDMSRLMNILFLVFACIGLADALGNFVILALEYTFLKDDPTFLDVLIVSGMGMIFTLVPLGLAAVLIFLYFKKK